MALTDDDEILKRTYFGGLKLDEGNLQNSISDILKRSITKAFAERHRGSIEKVLPEGGYLIPPGFRFRCSPLPIVTVNPEFKWRGGIDLAPHKDETVIVNTWNYQRNEEVNKYYEKQVQPLTDFFNNAIPNRTERLYLLGFITDLVRNPRYKSGTIPVLFGSEGVGKGFVAAIIGMLINDKNIQYSACGAELGSPFNSFFKNKRLLVINDFVGDKGTIESLKEIVTTDNYTLNQKGQEPIELPCFTNCLIISNQDEFCTRNERRFKVVNMVMPFTLPADGEEAPREEHAMTSPKYFTELAEFVSNNIDLVTTYFLQR